MLRSTVRPFVVLNLLALWLTGVAVADSQKYPLRYQFQPGAALHYTVGNESSIDVQVGTESENVSHSSESGRVLQSLKINEDGSSVLEISIEYVNLTANNGKISWDSRSGTEPPEQFNGIENTIGKPLMTITVAPNGAVTAAENNGKAYDKAQLEATQFDLFPLLPAEPVTVGESWTEPFKVDVLTSSQLPKSISLQRTYTLKSVSNGIAEIDVKTSVLTPIQDPLEEGQLIQRTPSGTLRLNIAQGRMVERVMKLDNQVIGFQGAQSVLHVIGMRQESLQSAEKAAAVPAGQAVK
jgi:hypothetical protein